MAIRQYIGARYVPRFIGSYDPTQIYEALDVVDNGSGTSYIARKTVPAGTPLTDTQYWFLYGSSSGAIINLQEQIDEIKEGFVMPEWYGAKGDGLNDDLNAFTQALSKNVPVILKNGATYLVSDTIVVSSGCYIIGNNATIIKTAEETHPIIQNLGRSSGIKDVNIYISNINLIGSGNVQVSDQGSGITIHRAENVVIENIKTNNTNGDGILLRNCSAIVRNVDIGSYGRNGMSPCSGRLYFENVNISGSAIAGANPGLAVDCESDNAEQGELTFLNCNLKNISFVDFYSTSGVFCYKILMMGCTFEGYVPVKFLSNIPCTSDVVIDKSNVITGHGALIEITKVNDITIDCDNVYIDSSGSTTNTIISIKSNIEGLRINNMQNADPSIPDIYSEGNIENSIFENCDMLYVAIGSHLFNNNKLIDSSFRRLNCGAASAGNVIDIASSIQNAANLDVTLQTYAVGDVFNQVSRSGLSSTKGTITGGIARIGRLVFVDTRVAFSNAAAAANDVILSGLPLGNLSFTPMYLYESNTDAYYNAIINASGELITKSAIPLGSYVFCTVAYISQS